MVRREPNAEKQFTDRRITSSLLKATHPNATATGCQEKMKDFLHERDSHVFTRKVVPLCWECNIALPEKYAS